MNINELINQKLEWLRYADEQHIAQKISTVCYVLGTNIEDNLGMKCNKFEDNDDIKSFTFWNIYGFNISTGHCNFKLYSGVKVNNVCVCQLAYVNDKPDFPINEETAKIYNIESSNYIFVPGKWLDRLNEKYKIALRNINSQNSEEEKRICKLAAQLLIEPKVEV